MKTEKGILFVSDGSITNPIIQSQGLPLYNLLGKEGYKAVFVTFEEERLWEKGIALGEKIKNEFPFVILHQIKIKRKKYLPNWISYFYYGILEISKIAKSNNVQTIQARSLFPGILSLIMKVFGKFRIVYDNRGVFIEEEIFKGHWKRKSLRTSFFIRAEHLLILKAESIVVVSDKFSAYLQQKHKIKENRITVIPNRTIVRSTEETAVIRNSDPVNIIYSGSGAAWQQIEELKTVIIEAGKIFGRITINILSYDIEMLKTILSNEINSESTINFMKADVSEVFSCLIKNNIGLLIREDNIINNVASPLKLAEYLAAGLPVLVSAGVGDTSEFIEKFKVGVVIRNKNYSTAFIEMKELLKDPEVYSRCRETAVKYLDINLSFLQYKKVLGVIEDV